MQQESVVRARNLPPDQAGEMVCFTREGVVPATFLAALHKQQIAWMSEARLGGIPVIRACITSFKTTERHIRWVVDEMNRLIE